MVKAHSPINWQNKPSVNTPINETNLNIMTSNIGYGIIEMPWKLSYLFVNINSLLNILLNSVLSFLATESKYSFA